MVLYLVAVSSLGGYATAGFALLGCAWLAQNWRSSGRATYLVLSTVDLLLIFPLAACGRMIVDLHFSTLGATLYVWGIGCAWVLLTRKRLPDWFLPLRGTWAKMALAASALLSLVWELARGIVEFGPRLADYSFVAVVFAVLIAYWYPLWWALVHGWKLPKKCEAS